MKTDRMILRLIKSSDFEEVLMMFDEPDIFKYIKHAQNNSREEHLEFLRLKVNQIELGLGYYWVIREIETEKLMGAINLTPIPSTGEIQIGWVVSTLFRNKGLAFEAAKAALDFGIYKTNFNSIYAVFEKENSASEKIVKKLNFQFHETFYEEEIELKKYKLDTTLNK